MVLITYRLLKFYFKGLEGNCVLYKILKWGYISNVIPSKKIKFLN